MGCTNYPGTNKQTNQIVTENTKKNEVVQAVPSNIKPISQAIVQKTVQRDIKPNYGYLGELIDFSIPFKEINETTSNILFLKDQKVIFGDGKGIIHVYYDLNFENSYDIKEFTKYIQCIIELSDGNIVAGSNDCMAKVLKIGKETYEIIKEIKYPDQVWSISELGQTGDFVLGNVNGVFQRLHKLNSDYVFQRKVQLKKSAVLNILGLSDSTAMIVYMSSGAYFFDFNSLKAIGYVPHQHFNPFKGSIQKINDHELLIGTETSIILIDYKNFQKIKEFNNDTTYVIYQLSEEYLLASYGEGFLQAYKMSRDINGQLELKFESRNKVIGGNITGITICPDGKLIIFNMTGSIKIWNSKNLSK